MGRAAPDVPDSMRGIHRRFARRRKLHTCTGRLCVDQAAGQSAR